MLASKKPETPRICDTPTDRTRGIAFCCPLRSVCCCRSVLCKTEVSQSAAEGARTRLAHSTDECTPLRTMRPPASEKPACWLTLCRWSLACALVPTNTHFYWSMACCQKWKVTHDTKIPVHITLTVRWHGDSMQNLATPITLARCVVLYRPTRRS